MPETAPINSAKSFETIFGREKESNGTNAVVPCNAISGMDDTIFALTHKHPSRQEIEVFKKFEQHINGTMTNRNFNESAPILLNDVCIREKTINGSINTMHSLMTILTV
jgi:hypothetical protein